MNLSIKKDNIVFYFNLYIFRIFYVNLYYKVKIAYGISFLSMFHALQNLSFFNLLHGFTLIVYFIHREREKNDKSLDCRLKMRLKIKVKKCMSLTSSKIIFKSLETEHCQIFCQILKVWGSETKR